MINSVVVFNQGNPFFIFLFFYSESLISESEATSLSGLPQCCVLYKIVTDSKHGSEKVDIFTVFRLIDSVCQYPAN